MPLAVTWAAREDLVAQGLTRHIGVSNFSGAQLKALSAGARIQPETLQIVCHPLLPQNELHAWCRKHGVVVTGYGLLGSSGPNRPPLVLQHQQVVALAAQRGLTPAQLLLAWGIGCGTAGIPKSVQPARLAENLAAAAEALDGELMARLAALNGERRLIEARFCGAWRGRFHAGEPVGWGVGAGGCAPSTTASGRGAPTESPKRKSD